MFSKTEQNEYSILVSSTCTYLWSKDH